MADFQFFLNRQGPRGPQGYKGDKGDDGKTPIPRTGTNTPIETTVIFDTGDGNPYETPNLKYPIEDRGGNTVMLDRTNSTQYYGTPDQATDNSFGVVKLATPESVLDDPLDSDVVTYELFDNNNQAIKTTTDGLAEDITQLNTDLGAEVTNRTNADTQLTNKINTDVGNEATARSNADTALSSRIDGLNNSKANKSDVYTKTQTDSLLNNKSNVGHTHNYNDLTNKPTIPTVGNGTITLTQGGITKGTFTTNQSGDSTIDLDTGGASFTTGTGLELTDQNILNVKIDGSTITTNADGELVASGGGGSTYIEGDAIDISNDTINVKYDGTTIGLNASGELQSLIEEPDMTDYYTKTQVDGLIPGAATSNTLGLVQPDGTTIAVDANGVISANIPTPETVDQTYDASSTHAQSGVAIAGAGFLNGNIVQSPLEYLPDTTGSLTYQNVNTSTMVGSGKGVSTYFNGSMPYGYNIWIGTESGLENFKTYTGDKAELISNSSLTWFETELTNGFNFSCKKVIQSSSTFSYVLGHYENNKFVPDVILGNDYTRTPIGLYIVSTDTTYYPANASGYGASDTYSYYLSALTLTASINGNNGNKGTVTVTQAEADILSAITHIRVYVNNIGTSTLALSDIKVINPTSATPVTDGNATERQTRFENGTNIFDAHPESLSLKYDNTTLGVNSSGQLYAQSSIPSNMVTTDTQQIITGRKDMAIINIQPSGSTGYMNYIIPGSTNGNIVMSKNSGYTPSAYQTGITFGFATQSSITAAATGGSASYINLCTEYGSNTAELRFCNGYTASQVGSSHAGIGKYGNYTYIRNNNANDKKVYKITTGGSSSSDFTNFFLEKDMLDGTTIQYNSTSGKVEVLESQQEGVLPVSNDVTEIYTTNYTIIGNPTITSDHVFSTTSGSDSLTSVVPFRSAAAATAHSLKFECQFRPTASSHSNGEGIFCRDSSSDGIRISLNASACVRFRTTINSSGALDVAFSNTPLAQNTLYKLTVEIAAGASSGTGTLYTSTNDGTTWTTAETVTLGTNTPLAIGSGASSLHYFGVNTPGPTLPFGGEILLDKMYLEEDGVVIWTPVTVTGNMTEIGKASENTYGLVKIDGTYLKYDSATGCVTLDIQAIKDAIDALT